MERCRRVGIVLFNEVEVLDFAGPFEVLSLAALQGRKEKPFCVQTVSQDGEMITARNGLKVQPDFSFATAPEFDVVIVPGGHGAREVEINNPVMLTWIGEQAVKVELLASVCTGAFLLAQAGLLDGKRATTHWRSLDRFAAEFHRVEVERNCKFVDAGNVITAAGISAGINMCFHIVKRFLGEDVMRAAAKRMEYDLPVLE